MANTSSRLKAAIAYPSDNYSGNLLWPGTLPPYAKAALPDALVAIRARGYFASTLQEGDGITFNRNDGVGYDSAVALADFAASFPFLEIVTPGPNQTLSDLLATLAEGRTLRCRYLAPVEGLHLDASIEYGETRLHPPVDGAEVRLADHPWHELCDVAGAEVDPDWSPSRDASGTTGLLAHALMERSVEVPLPLLFEGSASVSGAERLLRFLLDDADHGLDPLRFNLCHYLKLAYLPSKPGWIQDNALVYVMPEGDGFPDKFYFGKPYVLRVSNNWLGLEVDAGAGSGIATELASFVDDVRADEIALAIKSALRALNKAFYLIDFEAAFLHLVYAIDALCDPGKLKGERQRIWINAFASNGRDDRFAAVLPPYDHHYGLRNDLVHSGKTFASLGLKGEEACQFMLDILGSCIICFIRQEFTSRADADSFALRLLGTAPYEAVIRARGKAEPSLPIATDKKFKKLRQP